jgi:drug/metabolite transporter (DMT)-like permease
MNARLAVAVLCFSSIGWGLTWLPIKAINTLGLATPHLIFIAFSSAAFALLPWIYKQRKTWLPALPLMLALAALGGFANVAFQTAIAEGDVIRVMILFYMLPIWSTVGGKIFLRESIDRRRVIALLFCLSGAFFILEIWHFSWAYFTWVDGLALASGMGLAASNILFRFTSHIPLASKIGFMFIGCITLISAALFFFTETIAHHTNWLDSTPSLNLSTHHNVSTQAIPFAMSYGLIWLMLITFGSQWAVTQIEAGRSAVILVLELVAAVVSVVIITRSQLQLHELMGGLMVCIAAILEGSRKEPSVKDTLAPG